jgi:hypothetical protein
MSYVEDKLAVAERTRKHKATCYAAGICPSCHEKRPLVTGKKECRVCLDKHAHSAKHLRKTTEYGNKQRLCNKVNQRATKLEVFEAYGGLVCNACGETDVNCLSLDHVNNDGAEERTRLFGHRSIAGTPMYFYLKRHNYPDRKRYQVLCQSCQARKRVSGSSFKISLPWSEVKVLTLSDAASRCY